MTEAKLKEKKNVKKRVISVKMPIKERKGRDGEFLCISYTRNRMVFLRLFLFGHDLIFKRVSTWWFTCSSGSMYI